MWNAVSILTNDIPVKKAEAADEADSLMADWPGLLSTFRARGQEAADTWYMQLKEDGLQDKLAQVKARAAAATKALEEAKASAGIKSAKPKGSKEQEKARKANASRQVATFTGDGDITKAVPAFVAWLQEWKEFNAYLDDECSGNTPTITFTKLKSTLGGSALEKVSQIPNGPEAVDKAIADLKKIWQDPAKLASAYISELAKPAYGDAAKVEQDFIDKERQLQELCKTLEEDGIEMVSFFVINQRLAGMPERARNAWEVKLVDLEQASRQSSAGEWKRGNAWNPTTFGEWLRSYTLANPTPEETGAFLAGNSQSSTSCRIHKGSHVRAACPLLKESIPFDEFRDKVRAFNLCHRCLAPSSANHSCRNCGKCGGLHPEERCRGTVSYTHLTLPTICSV